MDTHISADVRVGQLWRTEDGYLYRIVALQGGYVYGRHPNSRQGSTQILAAWFDQPGWEMVRDTQTSAAAVT